MWFLLFFLLLLGFITMITILGIVKALPDDCKWFRKTCDSKNSCILRDCIKNNQIIQSDCYPDDDCSPSQCNSNRWVDFRCMNDSSSDRTLCAGFGCLDSNKCVIQINYCDPSKFRCVNKDPEGLCFTS